MQYAIEKNNILAILIIIHYGANHYLNFNDYLL